ncbi:family 2B encapsulin nanocompartment shell protein [Dactylosporangium sp. CS-033363]|uniref:family 2B encapsulin nanocompartment shell protein n=1 Tax=Dactylosporangium sp. CS-033363 TaxID=3239935 RepID=UPI003D8C1043
MTVLESITGNAQPGEADQRRLSLSTAAARNLATTTKSVPQMQEITSRWLLKLLPWVQAGGGAYRVNRRLSYAVGDGRVTFVSTGSQVQVIPAELGELPPLRGFDDLNALRSLADRFVQQEFAAGDVIVSRGQPADRVFLIAHGKINKIGAGEYGEETVLGVLADGDHFGSEILTDLGLTQYEFTAKALTGCTVLTLNRQALLQMNGQADSLREHIRTLQNQPRKAANQHGEAAIELSAGHDGEPVLPGTFVDYEPTPREYELSVAQTVLRVHSRVADLYNKPMDQVEQQLRLTIEALRERQEHELVNNADFGLLHNADLSQRVYTRAGAPGPDDMDELLSMVWKEPSCFLAHPRAIAAFGRECSRRGVYPAGVDVGGHQMPAWRGVPIFPSNKIGISDTRTTSIMLMRTGEQNQGVIGLHQTGLPDEYEPGLSVRFMGISEQAIISYLVSAYYSTAVLVPDALAILENVEIGREN